jgi:hypothetical protein
VRKIILLTGAGFSRDFGGFLGDKMWAHIFNDRWLRDNYPKIIDLANKKNDVDYETVYYEIHEGPFTPEERKAIDTVFLKAYKNLDDSIRYAKNRNNTPLNVGDRLRQFNNRNGEFFFTLNQDLLIERYFMDLIHIPFFQAGNRISGLRDWKFSTKYEFEVPKKPENEEPLNVAPRRLHYIKLHGSFNWMSSDGKRIMVFGHKKESQIANEPLLKQYLKNFKKELSREGVQLLIVGYGFRDEHINKIISQSNLELHIIDSLPRSDFIKDEYWERRPYSAELNEKIKNAYYHPYSLFNVFPSMETESAAWGEIKSSFFMD